MTYKEFQDKQESIYKDFEISKSSLTINGLEPKITKNTSLNGYLVICRHESNIAKQANNLSQKVSEIVPSLVYSPQHIHTTVSDYSISESTVLDKTLLEKLAQVVNNVKSKFSTFEISYNRWLINQNSIIAQGYSEEMFFNIADLIINEASKLDIKLRYPYMSHITVSRFFEPIKDQDKLEKLIKFVDETKPLAISHINTLEVGFVSHHEGKIDLISGGTININ
jgi:hypothetical protein